MASFRARDDLDGAVDQLLAGLEAGAPAATKEKKPIPRGAQGAGLAKPEDLDAAAERLAQLFPADDPGVIEQIGVGAAGALADLAKFPELLGKAAVRMGVKKETLQRHFPDLVEAAKGLSEAGDDLRRWAFEVEDPRFADQGLGSQLARGAGSMLPFAATGGLGTAAGLGARAGSVLIALTGAAQTAVPMYEDVLAETGDEDKAWAAAALGLGLGATEALGVGKVFAKLNRASAGTFRKALVRVATEGGEEAIQEWVQTFGQSVGTKALSGKEIKYLQEVAQANEGAAVGAILGGMVSGGHEGLAVGLERMARPRAPGQPTDVAKPKKGRMTEEEREASIGGLTQRAREEVGGADLLGPPAGLVGPEDASPPAAVEPATPGVPAAAPEAAAGGGSKEAGPATEQEAVEAILAGEDLELEDLQKFPKAIGTAALRAGEAATVPPREVAAGGRAAQPEETAQALPEAGPSAAPTITPEAEGPAAGEGQPSAEEAVQQPAGTAQVSGVASEEETAAPPVNPKGTKLRPKRKAEPEPAKPKATGNPAALRTAATKIREAATEEIGRERLENTPKRARQGQGARNEARRQIEAADVMERLAAAQEAGEAGALAGVTNRAQVDDLLRIVRVTEERQDEYGGKLSAQQLGPWGALVRPGNLKSVAEKAKGKKGVTELRKTLGTLLLQSDHFYVSRPEQLDAMRELAKMVEGYDAKQILEELRDFDRLRKIAGSREELAEAVKATRALRDKAPGLTNEQKAAERIKKAEADIRFQKIPGFFPTPPALVERVIDAAEIEKGMRVLEPSSGKGDLADAAKDAGGSVDVVERQNALREILQAKGYEPVGQDFDEFESEPTYDRIVMNPPFEGGKDIDHVRRAYEMLKPGGRLVAIMSEGGFGRGGKKDTAFREWLESLGGTSEKIEAGAFKGKGVFRETGVASRLVVIEKPAASATEEKPADSPFTPANLQTALGVTEEQAAALDALAGAMGLDNKRLRLVKGGKPGEGALRQGVDPKPVPMTRFRALGWLWNHGVPAEATTPLDELRRMVSEEKERRAEHVATLGKKLDEQMASGELGELQEPLLQEGKGAVEFTEAGTALIRALEAPDVSTGIHELAHVARRWVLDRSVPAENREGITDGQIEAAEKWAGVERGEWTTEAEEKFARGFERYLLTGKAPNPGLRALFAKLQAWLGEIYKRMRGSGNVLGIRVSAEMREVYDSLVSRGGENAEAPHQNSDTLGGNERRAQGDVSSVRASAEGERLLPAVQGEEGSGPLLGGMETGPKKGRPVRTLRTTKPKQGAVGLSELPPSGVEAERGAAAKNARGTQAVSGANAGEGRGGPREAEAGAVRGVRTPEGGGASRGLLETAGGDVAVPRTPSRAPQSQEEFDEQVDGLKEFMAFPGSVMQDLKALWAKLRRVRTQEALTAGAIPTETLTERSIRRIQDQFRGIKTTEAAVGGATDDDLSAYLAEELRRGKSKARLEKMKAAHWDPMLAGLRKDGISPEEAGEVLMARAAPDRNRIILERDPDNEAGSGMTDEEAEAILDRATTGNRAAGFERLFSRFDAMIAATREGWVADGLKTQEQVDELAKEQPFYAPMRSDLDEDQGRPGLGTGRGVDVRTKPFRQATGRHTRAEAANVLAYAFTSAEQSILVGEKTRVVRAFGNFIRANEDALKDFAEVGPTLSKPVVGKDGKVRWIHDTSALHADNVVAFWEDGKLVPIRINRAYQNVADALKNLGADNVGQVLGFVRRINRMIVATNLTYNPTFPLFNAIRDAAGAFINSNEHGLAFALRTVRDVPQALWALSKHKWGKGGDAKWDAYVREAAEAGAPVSYMDILPFSEKLKMIERDARAQLRPGTAGQIIRGFRTLLGAIKDFNEVIENGVRLSAYVHAREDLGMTPARAASWSKNLTVNFERKGDIGATVNTLYLFASAGIQSTARVAQAVKHPAVRRILAAGFMGMLAWDQLQRMLGGKDDDGEDYWDKIPAWEKRHNLIFMLPGEQGKHVTIPTPFVYDLLQTVAHQLSSVMSGDQKPGAALGEIASAGVEAFDPIGSGQVTLDDPASFARLLSPTFSDPLVELATNRDWKGSLISPTKWKERTPDSETFWPWTEGGSVAAARWLNRVSGGDEFAAGGVDVSPETLEHWGSFFTGGLGRTLGQLMTIKEKAGAGEPLEPRDIPFVSRLVREVDVQKLASDDFKELHNGLSAERDRAIRDKKMLPGELFGLWKVGNKLEDRAAQERKRIRDLKGDERKKAERALAKTLQEWSARARQALLQTQK